MKDKKLRKALARLGIIKIETIHFPSEYEPYFKSKNIIIPIKSIFEKQKLEMYDEIKILALKYKIIRRMINGNFKEQELKDMVRTMEGNSIKNIKKINNELFGRKTKNAE